MSTLSPPPLRETCSAADIAELYGFRWNAELDLRAIQQTPGLAHLRCKSPEMVRRELWTTLLGYNLIRTTAADRVVAECRTLLAKIAGCVVADRPGRIEPRVLKRRRRLYPLMQAPARR